MRSRKKRLLLLGVGILLAALLCWAIWENSALDVSTYQVNSSRLPEAFSGFRIVQISDLHNTDNEKLIPLLEACAPDIIVITGDLIDSRHTDVSVALAIVRQAVQIAPCYFVTGNHEALSADYPLLEQGLREAGVTVLRNDCLTLTREGQNICLVGLQDAGFQEGVMTVVPVPADSFAIALAHRPEYADTYVQGGYDLVLAGHSHGGQFRLPWLGGLIAPGQGLFPKYDGGLYTVGRMQMLVSRGIGNSVIPLRIHNPPELVLAILQTEGSP